ncbi:MAG: ROK family protein, partial [Sciscionella sp.]
STTLGWSNVPLADLVGERVDLPVVLVHDIGAAAAAEATRMSGGATANALFVGLGTGIGGCPIIEGQLLRGAHQRAGEIGHIAVCGADTPCGCGRSGCLETVASGRAIASAYRACARDDGPMTALEVAQAAERGDPVAAGVWTRACEALADGLATYSTLLDPGLVVLGGGLSLAGDRLLRPVRSHLATALALPGRPEVIAARFGDRGALHGAAIAARRLVGNTADPNLPSGDLPVAASPCGARPTPREPDGGCEA